ncbi:MAG: hypothetical protein H0W64_02160 [Gammaproteobacteria bacterium]|nr:hypothetical protein [Gammaproteobacteria bacterium]
MAFYTPKRTWLPYILTALFLCCSLLLWYLIDQEFAYYTGLPTQSYHPWLVLGLGLIIVFLIIILFKMMNISQQRAASLDKMNESLKNEIAERIVAQESQQKLEVALLQGQKLQSIGTLASGIAHDFNNILYAVIGYVEMAREDVAKDSVIYKNLGKVLEATARGQDLIARILAFSRRQHHHFEVIDLKTTIEAALGLLRPTIPASVMIQFAPIDAEVLGNQTQIHQVLVNIINNAVDAMDGEGTIYITMAPVPDNHPYLKQLTEGKARKYCKIEISDTGRGMDQHTMERIFEPFFTTKEVGKGTGLGLSIVHTIVKEHEGEIFVDSQLGHGTKFTILLPEQ